MKSIWPTKKLKDLDISFFKGVSVKEKGIEGNTILVSSAAVFPDGIKYDRAKKFNSEKYNIDGKTLEDGDVLLNCGGVGTLGRSSIYYRNPAFNKSVPDSFVLVLRSHNTDILPKYLFYYFQTDFIKKRIIENTRGTTGITSIRTEAILDFPIPAPGLDEQNRVIKLLDKALLNISKSKDNGMKSMLGAKALYESFLQLSFDKRGEGWVDCKLSEVVDNISTGPFGTMLHKSDYVADGIPLVNPKNIVGSKIIPSSKMMVNTETRNRLKNYVLQAGDIVIGRRGELGRCALVTKSEEGWLCGTGSFFVRLSDKIDGEFFVSLFSSDQFKSRLEANSVGATMNSLNHKILNNLIIPVPPIEEQKRIVKKSNELLGHTRQLHDTHERKFKKIDELRISLLDYIFSGNKKGYGSQL
jgi:type I restriction enzyme, S subunit